MTKKLSDAEVEALSEGYFYHYMLDKDHTEWAHWANKMGKLGLDDHHESLLAGWFANAMMATIDRSEAVYIKARLDSESGKTEV